MQMNERASRLPLAPLLLIAPFFLWGTAMVAMKGAIAHTSPLFMAGIRILPAGILILIFAASRGKPQPQGWKAWCWIGLFALVDGSLFQGFLAEGLVRTGAGLGSVMIDSQPIAVALMSLWLFQERIGLWGWLGLALGVTGISCIGLPDEWILSLFSSPVFSHSGLHLPLLSASEAVNYLQSNLHLLLDSGESLMLLAALSMAVGTVMIRFVCKYADPVTATGWHMILGGLPLWGISAVSETEQWSGLVTSDWLALGYATIFGSAIAYALFFYFASSGSLTSLSSLTFLTPVFALLFGNLLLGEVLTTVQWSGVGLTLVSIYLINQRDNFAVNNKKLTIKEITAPQPPNPITLPMRESEVGVKIRGEEY
ncbi:DMT family transporter [Calothrix sp. UHCC 0171]|uniref:DMT family transporter n=1 Tax=Calothrix sp. UHCC 0171 TaxID=3110245 RepID=UPI002B20E987|nr:DMT family transporter [Calothrix sp. UHCC 0171]MEA5571654.1 DMT family transporter [Calothrix sp. UHCC 0171]